MLRFGVWNLTFCSAPLLLVPRRLPLVNIDLVPCALDPEPFPYEGQLKAHLGPDFFTAESSKESAFTSGSE